jgi:hypothetical protein
VSTASRALPQPRRSPRTTAFRVVCFTCAVLLAWGWSQRDDGTLSARFGLGYALGIFGTSCMLLLLLYSLRKRARALSRWGPVRHWFNVHMMLGIVGPVAILFHCNFRLGSLNSNVALVCALLVAASGVVGRIVYPKIHHGLYGRRASVRELERAVSSQRDALRAAAAASPRLAREIQAFEAAAAREADGPLAALLRYAGLGSRVGTLRRACAEVAGGAAGAPTRRALEEYVAAVRRVAGFAIYERFFALWHAIHLPLCVLLFGAAIVHVIAVHMY